MQREITSVTLDKELSSPKIGTTLKERICSCRNEFFPIRVDPEIVQIHLKLILLSGEQLAEWQTV